MIWGFWMPHIKRNLNTQASLHGSGQLFEWRIFLPVQLVYMETYKFCYRLIVNERQIRARGFLVSITLLIAPFKGTQIPEAGKFLLIEFEILGFGIRNTAQGIRNPANDWNPESKFYWQTRLKSRIYRVHGIQNLRLSRIPLHGAIVEVNNAFPQKRIIVSLFSYYHYAVIFNWGSFSPTAFRT